MSFDPLAEALVDAQDQLLAMYELATLTADSLDRDTCVDSILNRAASIVGADVLHFELDEGSSADETPIGNGVRVRVENGAGLVGVLTAVRRAERFGTADQKLLRAVGQLALGALQTADLHERAVAQAMVKKDHDTASELAQLALPSWRPQLEGLNFFARSDPAKTAGGDLFTFSADSTQLHFVVGDVSGKGLPAAMVMAMIISAANAAMAAHGADPVQTIRAIDEWVYDYLSESGLFCTLVAGSIDAVTGEVNLANAGHSPVLHVTPHGAKNIEASAPPIGVLRLGDTGISKGTVQLSSGERLVMCSDGFTEQTAPTGEMWGDENLAQALSDQTRAVSEIGEATFEAIEEYASGEAQSDDRTLVIVEYAPDAQAGMDDGRVAA